MENTTQTGARKAVVESLIAAALDAMGDIKHTPSELLSACYTMNMRAIRVVLAQAPENVHMLRSAVQCLLLECVIPTDKVN